MEGKEKPNEYRKFRIQSIVGQDDYGAMKEMLSRRFSHGLREREENRREGKEDQLGRFSQFPDLILMDGGKGQVGICEAVLESLGISIPVCGMIKDEHHRTRALLVDNQEYPLSERSECFKKKGSDAQVSEFGRHCGGGLRGLTFLPRYGREIFPCSIAVF